MRAIPTDEAVSRERQVVEDLMSALMSASAVDVVLTGRPDEERGSGRFPENLTVDALLTLSDGNCACTWAVDVMNLSWDGRLIPAITSIEMQLTRELDAIAAAANVRLVVMYRPPVGERDRGESHLRQVLELARGVVAGEDMTMHALADDPYTQVSVEPPRPNAKRVELLTGLAGTANVGEQLTATLVPPLRKKLTKQLRRAHDLGYPTILAIDRVGPQSRTGNNFLASASAVGQVVAQTVVGLEHSGSAHCLDLAVLVEAGGTSPVFGYWPPGPCPVGGS